MKNLSIEMKNLWIEMKPMKSFVVEFEFIILLLHQLLEQILRLIVRLDSL